MGKHKAHPGALWEGEKQRFTGFISVVAKFSAFLVPGFVKKTQSAPGRGMGKHKAHPGALWEGEKQRLSGSSALLPSFELSWFLGLCKKTHNAPECDIRKPKRTRVHYGKGYRVHQRCCEALSSPGSRVRVSKNKAHPVAPWQGEKQRVSG